MAHLSFTEHPEAVGETYFEHMASAAGFGWRMFSASLACFLHALLPFLCVRTGSTTIAELHDRMVRNRHKHQRPDGASGAAEMAAE